MPSLPNYSADRPPLRPADDHELIAALNTAPIEHVTGTLLFEEIQAVGTAWRRLAQVKQDSVDEACLHEIVLDETEAQNLHTDRNRESRRTSSNLMRTMARDAKRMILLAQHNITYQVYGDEHQGEYKEQAKADLAAEVELYELGDQDGQMRSDRYLTKVYVETALAYRGALDAENDLVKKFVRWIGVHPNRFGELADWMNGDTADAQGENRPLFELLARFEFDPKLQFIDAILEHWEDKHEMLQGAVTNWVVDQTISQDAGEVANDELKSFDISDEDLSWVGFLPILLKQFGVTADKDLIKAALFDTSIGELPVGLREAIVKAHGSHLSYVRDLYLNGLMQHRKPSRFLAFDIPQAQGEIAQTSNKKKRAKREGGGGRTTVSKRAFSQVVEIEPVVAINAVHGASKTPRGYILTSLPQSPSLDTTESSQPKSGGRTPQDQLLKATVTQKHLARYQSDPRLAQDMAQMFESILFNPRGNGCSKLSNELIKLGNGGSNDRKAYPVWHLNPNKRTGLTIGDVGRKTRIYYAVIPGEHGEELVLLDISNKNVTDEYRSGDFFK